MFSSYLSKTNKKLDLNVLGRDISEEVERLGSRRSKWQADKMSCAKSNGKARSLKLSEWEKLRNTHDEGRSNKVHCLNASTVNPNAVYFFFLFLFLSFSLSFFLFYRSFLLSYFSHCIYCMHVGSALCCLSVWCCVFVRLGTEQDICKSARPKKWNRRVQ